MIAPADAYGPNVGSWLCASYNSRLRGVHQLVPPHVDSEERFPSRVAEKLTQEVCHSLALSTTGRLLLVPPFPEPREVIHRCEAVHDSGKGRVLRRAVDG